MKNDIRKQMLLTRKNIKNKKELSKIIVDKLLNLDIIKKSNIIALYNSLSSEVDTSYLINKLLDNKIVLLPRIENNEMIFVEVNKNTKYQKGSLGVFEPIGGRYLKNIDVIIVPGVSFDKKLNRLGFGKGYYDKYLTGKNIIKIGICFEEQIINNLPIDDYDIPMNIVITEKEFRMI